MTRLCQDFSNRVDALSHIDMSRVLVTVSQTRKRVSHGLYASVTPLRFPGAALSGLVRGRRMAMPIVTNRAGVEQYYVATFYLPRFLCVSFEEKLETVAHELWHISPTFDGTLREFAGTTRVHGKSRAEYDAWSRTLAARYLASGPEAAAFDFLKHHPRHLRERYGSLTALQLPRPKLIPLGEL